MADNIQEAKISIPTVAKKKLKTTKRAKQSITENMNETATENMTETNENNDHVVMSSTPTAPDDNDNELIPSDVSPMKASIQEQKERILEIINNAGLFKTNYQQLISNIIPSVNQQIKSYVKNGKKSILIDIADVLIDSIDWQFQQDRLIQRLKANQYLNISTWQPIQKPIASINQFDDDVFTNMIINCNVENVKEFQKYRKLAKSQLDDLINDIETFEHDLCEYRSETVKIMSSNLEILFNYHFNYVLDMYNKHKTTDIIIIDNKEIRMKKSQKEFITSAIKKLLMMR